MQAARGEEDIKLPFDIQVPGFVLVMGAILYAFIDPGTVLSFLVPVAFLGLVRLFTFLFSGR